MKQCSKCGKTYPATTEYFHRQIANKDGLNYWCKKCNCEACRKYRQTERAKIVKKKYQQSEKCKQVQKRYAATINGQQRRKDNHLKSKYNFTISGYNQLFQQQNGCCAICKKAEHVLTVDHDHNTGKIRGLLCRHCNTLLGHAKDNLITLHAAIEYLEYEKLSRHIA